MKNTRNNAFISKLNLIVQLSFYYVAWFSCIILASQNHGWYALGAVLLTIFGQVIWQIYIVQKIQGLWLMLGVFTFFGALIDTTLVRTGIIIFSANCFDHSFSPPWMISIWMSFAMIFYALLKKLHRQYIALGILSLIFFPIAYIVGARMGAAYFPNGYYSTVIIGIVWAIFFPICLLIYNYIENND